MSQNFVIHELSGQIGQSIYLAEYKDRLLLLDGGCRADAQLVSDFIVKKLQRSIEDLKLVVATHSHPDHSGAVFTLRKEYNVPIAAPLDTDLWYSGIGGWIQHKVDICLAWFMQIKLKLPKKRLFFKRNITADFNLSDGDLLPEFPDWKIISTPGHSLYDIVLYNEEESLLYAADLVLKVKEKFLPPFPVTLPKLMKISLKKVSQLKVKRILLAHGGIIDNPSGNIFTDPLQWIYGNGNMNFKLLMFISEFPSVLKKYKRDNEKKSME